MLDLQTTGEYDSKRDMMIVKMTRQPIQRPQRQPAGHTGPATRGVVNGLGSEVR